MKPTCPTPGFESWVFCEAPFSNTWGEVFRSGRCLPFSTGHFTLDLLRNSATSFHQSFPLSLVSRVTEWLRAHSRHPSHSWAPLTRLPDPMNTEILRDCHVEFTPGGELAGLGFTLSPNADFGGLTQQITRIFGEAPAFGDRQKDLARASRRLRGVTRHQDGTFSFSFQGVPFKEIGEFLARWTGDGSLAEHFLYGVDVMGQFLPYGILQLGPGDRVSLEAGCGVPSESLRWQKLLMELTSHKWCSSEANQTVLNWPKTFVPTAAEPWPPGLMIECLGDFQGRPSVGRRTKSFTLVQRDGEVSWETGLELGISDCSGLSQIRIPRSSCRPHQERNCDEAIEAGLNFLLSGRSDCGFWFDYDETPEFGYSETWTSLYIALHVHNLGCNGRAAAEEILDLMKRRRLLVDETGWGWNFHSPPDGDSCGWYFWLAQTLNLPAGFSLEESFSPFVLKTGGLSSYCPQTSPPNWTGWTQAHNCITAAGACVEGMQSLLLPFLREQQHAQGAWCSYWWRAPDHPTRLACRALSISRDPADEIRIAAAAEWAVRRLQDNSLNAFQLAASIETGLYSRVSEATCHEWLRRLLDFQKSDGGFPSHSDLLGPDPLILDPLWNDAISYDVPESNGFITTATALSSLALLRKRLS